VSPEPAAVYQERLAARRAAHARWERTDARLAHTRLAVFALAIITALVVWVAALTPWLLVAPLIAFLALMVRHDRVIRARETAARAIAYYERGLARIEDRWIGTGEPGTRFLDVDHPYAADLDLFGRGSLFELLSTARTGDGEETLAAWLLAGAEPSVIVERQQAVAEVAAALDLRERMAVAGDATRIGIDTTGLRAWAAQPPPHGLGAVRLTTYLFAVAGTIATAFLAIEGNLLPLGLVVVFQVAARTGGGSRLNALLDIASGKARELGTLGELLLEQGSAAVASQRLAALRDTLEQPVPAPRAIRALQRLAERRDWEHSLPLIPAGLFVYGFIGPESAFAIDLAFVASSGLLLYSPFLALAVERWRQAHGPHVSAWIAALAEFEALLAFGTYHFEHPQDPFPVIEPAGPGAAGMFDGAALGHPLLPAQRMVRNDVRLASGTQLLVVSGSNMSGKSTLLRTVGVNAVLALAGAPARAASLRLTPLRIGATLRIQDSLQEGRSRFFAEITRIRTLADLAAGPVPLLFLIDELLHGTNSHDRLVGGAGILRGLLARGAIGLTTTHDLALTAIADELTPRARNVHFEDFFEAGEIRFDYRIKPGPVTRSNALALMHAVGLDVEPEV
jgi:hypothetical protein